MVKPENAGQSKSNKGQQKTHLVKDAAGNQSEMTQEAWRNRDKSLGLERVDEVEVEEPVTPITPEPVVPAQA